MILWESGQSGNAQFIALADACREYNGWSCFVRYSTKIIRIFEADAYQLGVYPYPAYTGVPDKFLTEEQKVPMTPKEMLPIYKNRYTLDRAELQKAKDQNNVERAYQYESFARNTLRLLQEIEKHVYGEIQTQWEQ